MTLRSHFFRNAIRSLLLVILGSGLAMAQAGATAGQNVTGTVTDASVGKPLAHGTVTLLLLQNGMQPVSTSSTDAAGHYRFSETDPGPFLVQVDHQGVSYFAQVQKGQSETDVSVYDAVDDPKLMDLDAELLVLQPDSGQLAIVTEYRIENTLKPARTLAARKGQLPLFRFRVPKGSTVDMVRVLAPNEMPLAVKAQKTSDPEVYAVPTAFRPGETSIQVSYRVAYAGLKAALTETPVLRPAHFEVYVPNQMTFQGTGFLQVGTQDNYKVYGIAADPMPASYQFQVAGDAPMPQDPNAASSGAGAGSGASSAPSSAASPTPAAAVVPTPTFMERNLWTMLALLALAAAAGFGILLARPSAATAAAGGPGPGSIPGTLPATPAVAAATPAASGLGDDLARLKDDLFLLEVRHHTGNISGAEYNRQRAELLARMDRLAKG